MNDYLPKEKKSPKTDAISVLAVRRVKAVGLIDLRHRVLRHDQPYDSAKFDGDAEPTAVHLGVFDAAGTLVGCLTMFQRDWHGEPAWQLRGMAVDAAARNTGAGKALLAELDRIVAASDFSTLIWCNGRLVAKGFYERHGWKVESELFDIPTAGPHHKMSKRF